MASFFNETPFLLGMVVKNKIALVLLSAGIGGTERRIGNLFKFLSQRYPGTYHLIINKELYRILQKANYHLEQYPNVHIIKKKSSFDFKKGAHAGILINIGRVLTLFYYRKEIKRILKEHHISTIQVYLEMVPFLGVFPIQGVKRIASLVSHLPKYFDKKNINCKLLLYALKNYNKIDCLSKYIWDGLINLDVQKEKLNYPKWNFVNHIQFRSEKKEKIITFSARLIDWKNPLLILDAVLETLPHIDQDITFYLLGKGPILKQMQNKIKKQGVEHRIKALFSYDPSKLVNKSLIHVSIEEYDNFTNQSLLEGMASGCAIIASNVGRSKLVVTPDIGILAGLSPKDISKAIMHLLEHPSKTKRLGLNARKKILEYHDIDAYIDYIIRVQDFDSPNHIVEGIERPIKRYNGLRDA